MLRPRERSLVYSESKSSRVCPPTPTPESRSCRSSSLGSWEEPLFDLAFEAFFFFCC